MSLTDSGANNSSIARKPTPIGFQKHVENVSVARADTQQSLSISEKVHGNISENEIGNVPRQDTPRRRGGLFTVASQKLDHVLPRYKRYCFGRLSRKAFLIVIGIAILCLLITIVALAAVLSRKSSKRQNLPLPTNKQTFSGDLTYYDPGLGACGIVSNSDENIVAVSQYLFDSVQQGSNPNSNPLCGLKIRATRFNEVTNQQQSVDLTVVDRCVGCQPTDIDVTISAFLQLGDEARGRIPVTWAWLN